MVAFGVFAYGNSFYGVFILDDFSSIVNRPDIGDLWPPRLGLRFIVDLTFKFNYLAGGLKSADYHAVNLLIHILSGLAVYGIIRRTLSLPSLSRKWTEEETLWISLSASVIWLVHPLQTESVTYICQRYESMMGLFLLSSLYCFIRSTESSRPRLWSALAIAACSAGMGSKECMVVAHEEI